MGMLPQQRYPNCSDLSSYLYKHSTLETRKWCWSMHNQEISHTTSNISIDGNNITTLNFQSIITHLFQSCWASLLTIDCNADNCSATNFFRCAILSVVSVGRTFAAAIAAYLAFVSTSKPLHLWPASIIRPVWSWTLSEMKILLRKWMRYLSTKLCRWYEINRNVKWTKNYYCLDKPSSPRTSSRKAP